MPLHRSSSRHRVSTRRFASAVRSQVRAGSSAAIDLSAYDWSDEADPDPTEPIHIGARGSRAARGVQAPDVKTREDAKISARGCAVPAPVTLSPGTMAPATLAPSELELDDTESIPMDPHLPTQAEEALTVDTGQILEMFVDPTEGVELSTFSSYCKPVTVSRVESMCLPSQSSPGVASPPQRAQPEPIDPVVFEVTDHARAQLDDARSPHKTGDDSDVWA